jgi:hypothetical protein
MCLSTIRHQTYKDFVVYELNYGGSDKQLYEGSIFESKLLNNHAEAHNHLLDKVFADGFDVAFNTNIDDYYTLDRLEKQIEYIKRGYDVVSSNFYWIDKNNVVTGKTIFHVKNIMVEARKNHNIIAHPVCAYSKKFWTNCTKLIGEQIPKDDFELWKRSFNEFRFTVIPDYLLYYRIHENNTGKR